MTISTTVSRAGPFTPDGVTTDYPFTFPIMSQREILLVDPVAGTVIDPSLYDVTIVGEGGTVSFHAPLPAGHFAFIIRPDPDFTQMLDLQQMGPFLPAALNKAFDRAAARDIALLGTIVSLVGAVGALQAALGELDNGDIISALGSVLLANNNLGDVSSPAAARTNLGLGSAALLNIGTGGGTAAAGDDARITGALQKGDNLGALTDKPAARTNLGLGSAAQRNFGLADGEVPLLGYGGKLPASVLPAASGGQAAVVDDYLGDELISGGTFSGQPDYTPAFNRAKATGAKTFLFRDGVHYTSGALVMDADYHFIRGSSKFGCRIVSTNANAPVISRNLALTGQGVCDLAVSHDPALTLTSTATGIDFWHTGSLPVIERVYSHHNWDGFRCGGTDYGRLTDCEANTNVACGFHFVPRGSEGTLIYVNTNLQWNPLRCAANGNGSDGYLWESLRLWGGNTFNGVCTSGEMSQCIDFSNGRSAVRVLGTVACPFVAIRITGGFFGQNVGGNDLIYLDTYGSGHVISPTYMELSTGNGLRITENNSDVTISVFQSNGHSLNGIYTQAAVTLVTGGSYASCGQANDGVNNSAIRVGPRITAGPFPTLQVSNWSTQVNVSNLMVNSITLDTGDAALLASNCDFRGTVTAIKFPTPLGNIAYNSMVTGSLPFTANYNFHTAGDSAFVGNVYIVDPVGYTGSQHNSLYVSKGGVVANALSALSYLNAGAQYGGGGAVTSYDLVYNPTTRDVALNSTLHITGAIAIFNDINMIDKADGTHSTIYSNSGGAVFKNLATLSTGSTYFPGSVTVGGDLAAATAHVTTGSFGSVYASGASQFSADLYVVSGGSVFINGGGQILKAGTAYNNP